MLMRLGFSVAALVLPVAVIAATAPTKKASSAFPAGPAMAKVAAACSTCHARDIVLNAKKSRAQWETSLDRMIDRGAKVSDADYDQVVDYLVKNFGTGK
jgi:CO dehydrogenase/acetyl-CoA synthase alpha subunit